METLKYLKNGEEDSAGHINEISGIDSITIHCVKNRMAVSVQLNKYKDSASKLAGKSPSIDKVRPERLFFSDLETSLVDFHNMIVDSLAKKYKLEVVEIDAELQLKSPAELKTEKAEKVLPEKGTAEIKK